MANYRKTQIRGTTTGKRYFTGVKYPSIPLRYSDDYVITTIGDRFDIMAQKRYGDSGLWWIISIANPNLPQNSYSPPLGIQLRIPTEIASIVSQVEKLNEI